MLTTPGDDGGRGELMSTVDNVCHLFVTISEYNFVYSAADECT